MQIDKEKTKGLTLYTKKYSWEWERGVVQGREHQIVFHSQMVNPENLHGFKVLCLDIYKKERRL